MKLGAETTGVPDEDSNVIVGVWPFVATSLRAIEDDPARDGLRKFHRARPAGALGSDRPLDLDPSCVHYITISPPLLRGSALPRETLGGASHCRKAQVIDPIWLLNFAAELYWVQNAMALILAIV